MTTKKANQEANQVVNNSISLAESILLKTREKSAGLFKTSLGGNRETIYKKELFVGCSEKKIKSLRKKFRNTTFSYLEEIGSTANEKIITDFIDFYKQVYIINDFSFSSIASENTKEAKKGVLLKGLEVCKKYLNKK